MAEEEKKVEVSEQHQEVHKPRPNLWKLLTLVLAAGILVAGAYYIGSQGNNVAIAPTPSPSGSVSPTVSSSPSASITPTPTKTPTKNVEAGDNIGIFLPYRIQ